MPRVEALAFHDRREIFPRSFRLAGQTLTIAPGDRREIFTELEEFCRCFHNPASLSRHRSRCRLAVWLGADDDA